MIKVFRVLVMMDLSLADAGSMPITSLSLNEPKRFPSMTQAQATALPIIDK